MPVEYTGFTLKPFGFFDRTRPSTWRRRRQPGATTATLTPRGQSALSLPAGMTRPDS